MLPELATLQQGSVPASGGSTFSAAASSPAGLRVQVVCDPCVRLTAVVNDTMCRALSYWHECKAGGMCVLCLNEWS